MSNSLDPDQDQHFVSPDLGPNCFTEYSGVSKLVFLAKKLKPLVAKQNRASLLFGAVINFSIPRAQYQLAIPLSNL